MDLDAKLPWLRQGDVFRSIPWVLSRLVGAEVEAYVAQDGGALLVTENCQMDKRIKSESGFVTRLDRLQFAPLRLVEDIPNPDIRRRIRQLNPNPPDPVFVGDVLPDQGDWYASLSEIYDLPAAFFGAVLRNHTGDVDLEDDDPWRLVAAQHDTRAGTLPADRLHSMRQKMVIFWTKHDPGTTI